MDTEEAIDVEEVAELELTGTRSDSCSAARAVGSKAKRKRRAAFEVAHARERASASLDRVTSALINDDDDEEADEDGEGETEDGGTLTNCAAVEIGAVSAHCANQSEFDADIDADVGPNVCVLGAAGTHCACVSANRSALGKSFTMVRPAAVNGSCLYFATGRRMFFDAADDDDEADDACEGMKEVSVSSDGADETGAPRTWLTSSSASLSSPS